MASALTLQGLQTVQNLTVRNNLAVQNQLQAKHLIADNVVQVNAAHRDYGQLVLGSASKITGSMNISSNTVIADGEASIDDVVLASGSTASIPIKSKAISPNVPSATNINATMFNPFNTEVNSFVGYIGGNTYTSWKTHAELDTMEAHVASTFVATPLQRDMASLLDASTADQAIIGTNIDIDTLFAQYNIDHAQWVIDHNNWQQEYDNWSIDPMGDAPVEPVEPDEPLEIKYYPNPTTGTVTVELQGAIKELYLTDISGKLIKTYKVSGDTQLKVDLSDYSTGIYFLKCFAQNKSFTGKIMLTR